MNFGEIWLYKLLGHLVSSMECCICFFICIDNELYAFKLLRDIRRVNAEENGRQNSILWYFCVDAFEFIVCVVVFGESLS